MTPPLTLVEELVLLSLDHSTGAHLPLMPEALAFGLAGAVLSDLEMSGRIATAEGVVTFLNPTPLDNPALDESLAAIAAEQKKHPITYWLSVLSEKRTSIEEAALDRLIARGILKREEKKILWVFGVRRYPTVHNEERVEVRARLAGLIAGDQQPQHFDATLISLLSGCCLLPAVFHGPDFDNRADRIAEIANADPVGREVASASRDLIDALMLAQSTSSTPY
jgi:hypothetical protein